MVRDQRPRRRRNYLAGPGAARAGATSGRSGCSLEAATEQRFDRGHRQGRGLERGGFESARSEALADHDGGDPVVAHHGQEHPRGRLDVGSPLGAV